MNHWRHSIGPVAVAATMAASALALPSAAQEYVPGQAIVRFKPAVPRAEAARAVRERKAVLARRYGWLSANRARECALVRSDTRTTDELISDLRRDPRVETAEPDYLRRVSAVYTPNDPRYGDLWGLRNTGQTVNGTAGAAGADIGFPQAWPLSRAPTCEVVVAVIDTGCDYLHPDLAPNMWHNPWETRGNGVDDDGNGYVDDYCGFDFAATTNAIPGQDADPMDSAEHGTHVCGTIAAVASNAVGVAGVNPMAHIMILKASGSGTDLPNSSVLASYEYIAAMKSRGINITAVNASYGGPDSSQIEADAIAELGNLGIVFCAAAGNDGRSIESTPSYPASYTLSNIIAVAATDQRDALASFSNYGTTSVDLAAPGVNILSCRPQQSQYLLTTASVIDGAATLQATGMTYAGVTTGITATAYSCAYGDTGSFPPQVSNNIALIQRGPAGAAITFAAKVSNAMAAGAVAAVIYNNVAGGFSGTLQTGAAWIPAVSISQADGIALTNKAPAPLTVVNSVSGTAIYRFMDGTSMATPHVAGVVSFLALNFPEESVTQRIARVVANVTPAIALFTRVKSGGRLNMLKAIDTDSDSLPDWWEKRYFGGYTNGVPTADSNSNGTNNLAEWTAGASPTYRGAALNALTTPPASTGLVINWSSETGNVYVVQRSTNLISISSGFSNITAGIPATPPSNTYTDKSVSATGPYFYRIELQP